MVKEYVFAPCFGGLRLSDQAIERLRELGITKKDDMLLFSPREDDGMPKIRNKIYHGYIFDLPRDDPRLLQVVKELGTEALGDDCSRICIAAVPDDVDVYVESDPEFDHEWVAEVHRIWKDPVDCVYTFERKIDE